MSKNIKFIKSIEFIKCCISCTFLLSVSLVSMALATTLGGLSLPFQAILWLTVRHFLFVSGVLVGVKVAQQVFEFLLERMER